MAKNEREQSIYKITWAGSAVNLALVVFKLIAGFWGHSAAMIADGVHSLSDFLTDIVVIVFVRISSKPQDKDHDYGHGKYETLATAIIGIALFAVGAGICWDGLIKVQTVWQGGTLPAPGMLALCAALVSILFKELIFRATYKVGKRVCSAAVIANAWHHRSDALSSIGTAIGIGGAICLGSKWHVLDPLAAIVVSLFIIKVSVSLLKPSIDELTERSLPDTVENQIARITQAEPGVSELHNLRTRRIGNHYAIEMHIRMDGHLSLQDAHAKATAIERRLKEMFGKETHIGIHVEPTKRADGTYGD